MTDRRRFIAQLGAAASAMALDAEEMRAMERGAERADDGKWDTSWIERVERAKYRVVFNASDVSDGAALAYASTFLDHFREVHGTNDGDTRAVIVFRRRGTPMVFGDALWDRYEIGAEANVDDRRAGGKARRNVFWKPAPGASPESASSTLESLAARGLVSLVCNISIGSWSHGFAERSKRDVEEVRREVLAGLVPGTIVVPSGIYALIRAQNAGCAYMPGT